MHIIIVGGGKMGRFLAKEFAEKGYAVTLVEQNIEKSKQLALNSTIRLINGDGSEIEVLKKAGIEEVDVLLAVTNNDHDNLAICQLAERQFHVPRTFTAVNTPGNEKLFEWLGVNVAVSSSSILAALVDQKFCIDELSSQFKQQMGDLEMVEVIIKDQAPVVGSKIKDLDLPMESILVTLLRGNSALVPRGNTIINVGDTILALTDKDVKNDLMYQLNGG